MERTLSRYTEFLLLTAVLATAAILRLGWPGLTEFKADEARLLALAYDMANGQFALRGISSSVGFPNFPMSVWLYAIPSLIWQHPYAATIFTGLLNTAAVGGCYWFVRRYWGVQAALAATIMLTVSPWAIIFSRKIWAQNLLPLFVLGWGISGVLAFVEQKQRSIWLHFLCLAIAVQIHLAAVALIPATAVYLLVFRRRVQWKQVGMGVVLAGGTAVPFLVYLWQQYAGTNLSTLVGSGSPFTLTPDSFRFAAMLSLGADIHALAGPEAYTAYLTHLSLPLRDIVLGIWGILMIGGVIYAAYPIGQLLFHRQFSSLPDKEGTAVFSPQKKQAEINFILLVWLFMPPLFFLGHNTPIFIHYFIATLPVQYIMAGIFISRAPYLIARVFQQWLPASRVRLMVYAAWITLLITAVFHLYAWGTLLNFVGKQATPGGFGTPLALQLQAVSQVKTLMVDIDAAEVLIGGRGDSPDQDEFAAIFHTLLHDIPHRFVDARQTALFPANPAVVLLQNDDTIQDMGRAYGHHALRSWATLLRRAEGAFQIIGIPGQAAPTPAVPFTETYLFNNWVNPFGYDWQAAGKTAVYDLYWHTGGNPDPADYHFFNHLLNADGQRVAQTDAAAFTPWQWHAGDVVVSRFTLDLPETADSFTLRTGMYRYPSLEPVLLLDVAGNPYTDAIEIHKIE